MSGEQRIQAEERSAAAPHPLVARKGREETTRVRVGAAEIGGEEFVVAAGPCAVEREQLCLRRLRERIDGLDEALVRLLIERAKVAVVIGRAKRASGLSIHAPEREDDVLRNVAKLASAPLGPREIERIFRTVIEETRRAEEGSQ